jgi:hypothetical protein
MWSVVVRAWRAAVGQIFVFHFFAGLNSFQKSKSLRARNFSGLFEDEDDASAEALAKEDLVTDFGVRLRRAQSSRLVERYAAL